MEENLFACEGSASDAPFYLEENPFARNRCRMSTMATESIDTAPSMLDDLSEEAEMSPFSPDPFASMAPVKVSLDFNWLLSQQSASGMFKFAPSDPRFSSYSSKNINAAVAEKLALDFNWLLSQQSASGMFKF